MRRRSSAKFQLKQVAGRPSRLLNREIDRLCRSEADTQSFNAGLNDAPKGRESDGTLQWPGVGQ
jgi:hypothetical protein